MGIFRDPRLKKGDPSGYCSLTMLDSYRVPGVLYRDHTSFYFLKTTGTLNYLKSDDSICHFLLANTLSYEIM